MFIINTVSISSLNKKVVVLVVLLVALLILLLALLLVLFVLLWSWAPTQVLDEQAESSSASLVMGTFYIARLRRELKL